MKKLLTALGVGLLVVLSNSPLAANAASCTNNWGSLPKAAGALTTNPLVNIRTGQHDCYDRMVFDISGSAGGYDVRYVDNVYTEGSGMLVPLKGGAKLRIIIKSPAYDPSGNPTYPAISGQPLPNVNLAGYQTFRDAKYAGSFEGQTTVGLGVRARLPFRVFILGDRIVLDVAHHW